MEEVERHIYIESLSEDQVAFLERRYANEISKFKKARKTAFKLVIIAGSVFTLLFFLINKYAPIDENDQITERVSDGTALLVGFICTCVLLFVMLVAFVITYFSNIHRLKLDVTESTKIVESAHILELKFMPHNQTYHFILDSPTRYSMEVEKADFDYYIEGDEINLEYTVHSKTDLGYF